MVKLRLDNRRTVAPPISLVGKETRRISAAALRQCSDFSKMIFIREVNLTCLKIKESVMKFRARKYGAATQISKPAAGLWQVAVFGGGH
jgi:hypothetical protein